jgi:hypothetical protein
LYTSWKQDIVKLTSVRHDEGTPHHGCNHYKRHNAYSALSLVQN